MNRRRRIIIASLAVVAVWASSWWWPWHWRVPTTLKVPGGRDG